MRRQQMIAICLAALMILLQCTPVRATTPEGQEPEFRLELVGEGRERALIATWNHAPADLENLEVTYAFNGAEQNYTRDCWNVASAVDGTGRLEIVLYDEQAYPLSAFLSKAINTVEFEVHYSTKDYADWGTLGTFRFSNGYSYEIPQESPFTATIVSEWSGGYTIWGHFEQFLPNTKSVETTYSLDGLTYQPFEYGPRKWALHNLGVDANQQPEQRERLQNQDCGSKMEEPLRSYINQQIDEFYLRLQITTEDDAVYFSQAVHFQRGTPQPLPSNLTPRIALDFNVAVAEEVIDEATNEGHFKTKGRYEMTAPDNASASYIQALLPDTVPVIVWIWDKNNKTRVGSAKLDCAVQWKSMTDPTLTAGEPYVIADAAEPLVIPAGTVLNMATGSYILQKPLTFQSRYDSDIIDLVINPVAQDADPNIVLSGYQFDPENECPYFNPLSLAFVEKPSGATSIQAYAKAYTIDGDVRTESWELLNRRDVNHNQSEKLYGYIDLLQAGQNFDDNTPGEFPYQNCIDGEIESFTIEVSVTGGVFDGKQTSVMWPGDYVLPPRPDDVDGFDGEENNAGASFEVIVEEDDGTGQRPWLPTPIEPTEPTEPETEPKPEELPKEDANFLPLEDLIMEPKPTEENQLAQPSADNIQTQQPKPTVLAEQPNEQPLTSEKPTEEEPAAEESAETKQKPPVEALPPVGQMLPKEPTESPPDERTQPQTKALPLAVTAAVVTGGAAVALAIGGTASGASGGLLDKLRGLAKRITSKW